MFTYLNKTLLSLIFILVVFGCDFNKSLINTNISSSYQPFKFFISYDTVLYLLGNNQNKLVLYESKTKDLKFWQKFNFNDINGNIVFVNQDSDKLYVGSFWNNNTQITSISKRDKKVNKIGVFENGMAKNIVFSDNLTFLIVNEFINGGISSVGYKLMLLKYGIFRDTLILGRSAQ